MKCGYDVVVFNVATALSTFESEVGSDGYDGETYSGGTWCYAEMGGAPFLLLTEDGAKRLYKVINCGAFWEGKMDALAFSLVVNIVALSGLGAKRYNAGKMKEAKAVYGLQQQLMGYWACDSLSDEQKGLIKWALD